MKRALLKDTKRVVLHDIDKPTIQEDDAVLECVGARGAMEEALKIAAPGALIGRVGVPHDEKFDLGVSFGANAGITGGIASVTTYDKGVLLKAVQDGAIHPGKVFTSPTS